MKPRPTYLLLFLLLFAKSYASAIPVCKEFSLFNHSKNKAQQAIFLDAGKTATALQGNSFFNEDNDEEEEDSASAVEQTFPGDAISSNSIFVSGFLVPRFKNAAFRADFYSSYPPVYLRLRVLRI
jgi:hypothetical protein